jgi:hypothetical protein
VEWVIPQKIMASRTQVFPGSNPPYRVVCLAGKVGSTAPKRPPNQPAIAPRRRVLVRAAPPIFCSPQRFCASLPERPRY